MTIRAKNAAAVAALSLSLTSAALAQQTAEEGDAPAATDGGQTTSGMGMQGGMGPGMMQGGMGPGMMQGGMGPGMMQGGGGMGPGAMMMMFVLMDADGDEALSLEEVLSVHERMFNYIDADDDGSVTMEEARGFMQRMHGPMR